MFTDGMISENTFLSLFIERGERWLNFSGMVWKVSLGYINNRTNLSSTIDLSTCSGLFSAIIQSNFLMFSDAVSAVQPESRSKSL